jgi:CHRD domain
MRKRIIAVLTVALAIAGLVTAIAMAHGSTKTTKFSATLNIAQEVPKETGAPASAGGTFSATLSGTTLKWSLSFTHLTGPASAAHIHLGAKGKSGPVIIPLCGPCKSPLSGTAKVTAAEIKDLTGGKTYANVHTAKNPNGEIRGQVS